MPVSALKKRKCFWLSFIMTRERGYSTVFHSSMDLSKLVQHLYLYLNIITSDQLL